MRVYTTGATPKRHMTSGRAAEAVRLYLPPMLVSIVALPIFAAEAPERKVYAHYMGCWPAQKCLSEQKSSMPDYFRAVLTGGRRNDYRSWVGGRMNTQPLLPLDSSLELGACLKLEIARALRAGIDGFAVDAWAGRDSRFVLDALFSAAEEMKADFGITICFDPACHRAPYIEGGEMWERFSWSAKWLLRHAGSPNLARFRGKPLFFGYHSSEIVGKIAGESPAAFRSRVKEAWRKWRQSLPCEVYLHGCIGGYVDGRHPAANDWAGIARDCAETYDAAGSFLGNDGNWGVASDLWRLLKDNGCGWSQPLFWQYDNKKCNVISGAGLERLHENWRLAIERGSELLQFVTWNDYGEETSLAPTRSAGYTVGRVNRWYSDMWKLGREPEVKVDEVHAVYRRTVGGAASFPFLSRRVRLPEALEIVTFLTAPAEVEVCGYGRFAAPKGMSFRRFELKPGAISATVRRANRMICGLVCPEPVSTKRWREDFTAVAHGSDFDRNWREDFRDAKRPELSEMADSDGNGLPNWFEAVYFGSYPELSSGKPVPADADPDADGFPNIEEYRNNTNPLVADKPYAADFRWNLSDVLEFWPYAGNPARDSNGRPVWRFLGGSGLPPISVDGDSLATGSMVAARKGGPCGVVFRKAEHGSVKLVASGGEPVAVEWVPPVDCVVDASASVRLEKGDRATVALEGLGCFSAGDEASVTAGRDARLSLAAFRAIRGSAVRLVLRPPEPKGSAVMAVRDFSLRAVGVSAKKGTGSK